MYEIKLASHPKYNVVNTVLRFPFQKKFVALFKYLCVF